jgi:hypothetical protein
MPLPDPIIEVLTVFRPLFTAPTWRKVMTWLTGTLLARGHRTVAAALRASGNGKAPNWSSDHSGPQPCSVVSTDGEPPAAPAHRRDVCESLSRCGPGD